MQPRPGRFLEGPPSSIGPLAAWLVESARRPENRGALVHLEVRPARAARYGELARPLPETLAEALAARGIERLYTHQVRAIEALRGSLDTVVVTGTASGKSLCYHVPVLERLLDDPRATALYLFPTKALAQDQFKSVTRLAAGHLGVMRAVTRASTTGLEAMRSAVILAGGNSHRLGLEKALLEFDGRPLICWTAKVLLLAADEVVVVAKDRDHARRLAQILLDKTFLDETISDSPHSGRRHHSDQNRIRFTWDSISGFGPVAGLEAGLRMARGRFAFATACDLPF